MRWSPSGSGCRGRHRRVRPLSCPIRWRDAEGGRVAGRAAGGSASRCGGADSPGDLRFSPFLVLAFTTPELAGKPRVQAPVAFVGPSLAPPDPARHAAMPLIDPAKPLVYTALGTVNADAGERFLTACAQALGDRPDLQAVLADPAGADPAPPGNVRTLAYTPQQEIIAGADAVICHARPQHRLRGVGLRGAAGRRPDPGRSADRRRAGRAGRSRRAGSLRPGRGLADRRGARRGADRSAIPRGCGADQGFVPGGRRIAGCC